MPDKLTDSEIVKDFTEKTELIGSMSSIYLDEDKGLELYEAMRNILILINRLQAEKEVLKARIGVYETCNARKDEAIKHLESEIKRLQAENERLKKEYIEQNLKKYYAS